MEKSIKIANCIDHIEQYGGIDGSHHKQWLLNELIKILVDDYDGWVASYEDGEDGPGTYEWDTGIAP